MSCLPSTARTTSPDLSLPAAGEAASTLPTTGGGWSAPSDIATAAKIANASTMFTNGPAAITTIRFHGGWR